MNLSPTERAAQSRCDAWNAAWAPSSPVSVRVDDTRLVRTTTAGKAVVYQGEAVIVVASTEDCPPGPWPLDRVMPTDTEMVAAAGLRGAM